MSKDDARFIICQHPQHKAVLEIIEAGELVKWEDAQGEYLRISSAKSRLAALNEVQRLLLAAYEEDPSLEQVRTLVAKQKE